jgi:hypothetical protein
MIFIDNIRYFLITVNFLIEPILLTDFKAFAKVSIK